MHASLRSFEATIQAYVDMFPGLIFNFNGSNTNPTLDEMRGKFVILQNFEGKRKEVGHEPECMEC